LAIQEIEAGNWVAKGQYLRRAQDILEEFNAVLGREGGGEIAQNLRGLHLHMNRRLFPANAPKDPEMIREVIARMEDLNQRYKTITGQELEGQSVKSEARVPAPTSHFRLQTQNSLLKTV
jgi:flagellar biosynthetic protein FliS